MRQAALAAVLLLLACGAAARDDDDGRRPVRLPESARQMLVANMNDHQLALHEILTALGQEKLDRAAEIAETRLGRSWQEGADAALVATHLPPGMRELADSMHQAASEFAETAREGEPSRALAALARVTRQCVGCHALYRLH